ncbi:hypothetical protein Vadar_014409 [Vaccinium darrowii]|uniref:Uncharacterized protein n=1 Tax=Vaccinium darrowii TaxID=229202 RepID=A0ACB7XYW5_9ERIC|nr:hypothetical protein Vadar_014409 [Vaccinium darrowii]
MASSSKSLSAHHREDLSPTDVMVEESLNNEVRLSKRKRNTYSYPEHLKVEILVPNQLGNPFFADSYVEWNKGYVEWRQKMVDVITREGLLDFIDGTVQAPPKTVTTSVNGPKGGNTTHEERENEEYVAWKRSDDLVWEWILNRLVEFWSSQWWDRYKSAKELWEGIAGVEQRFRLFHYLPLYKAAIKGNWETADKFIQEEPDAVRARITVDSETALIVAVKRVGGKDFVEKLVEKMSPDDLAIPDNGSQTALHRAAGFGNIEVAKLLVGKNEDLPNMTTDLGETALFYATERGDRKMVDWLMGVTALYNMAWDLQFRILYQLTHSQLYDIALKLLKEYPSLAYPNLAGEEDLKFHALATLAGTPSSFKSGNNFNFLQEFIYSRMKIKKNEGMALENTADNHSRGAIEVPLASNNSGAASGEVLNFLSLSIPLNFTFVILETSVGAKIWNGGWAYAVRKKMSAIFSKVIEIFSMKFLTNKNEGKESTNITDNHSRGDIEAPPASNNSGAANAINPYKYFKADRNFRLPLEQATSMGIHEIVEEILLVYPYAIYLVNDKKQSIFQQAIVFRQEKVFSLIYQHEESKAIVLSKEDDSKNNALHLAGYVAHPEQLYRRAGAALQVQRELQWFKEVERLVLPKNKEERNEEGKTPAQVFSDAHKELVKEGERWMKDTASSCTIIASLIATVVFAAAITIPGGNKPDGPPNFDQQPAFLIFGIFNALSLFSSIASVVLFLSILTSRYAEEDFLATLPKRLIIGLICLFLSLLFMMTAFGATLYLVFGKNKGWVLIPAGVLGCIPVTLFCALQFPLLKDMIKSTYGSGIFDNKSDRIKNLKRS